MTILKYDIAIIGGGIIGLTLAWRLIQSAPRSKIVMVEKEEDIARHASGRNSGVLHAGFYYTEESLKARLCVEGNRQMKAFCQQYGLSMNACGKLVVARNAEEVNRLEALYRRGRNNGVDVSLVTAAEAQNIEPNIQTYQAALYSPSTASVNPRDVCRTLKQVLKAQGVHFLFNTCYRRRIDKTHIQTNRGIIQAEQWINAAGMYADKIARDYGYAEHMTLIPFKGLYLKYAGDQRVIQTHIYPVPHLRQPFLGVHYTKTVAGEVKIGPTAVPALWRENYRGLQGFKWQELLEVLRFESQLFLTNAFGFRELAFEEVKKYRKAYFIGLARSMVKEIDSSAFGEFMRPGIRAQLMDTRTLTLIQDFVVQGNRQNLHILNAVSPAFTCAFAFADYIVETYL